MAKKGPPKLSPGRPVFGTERLLRVPDLLNQARVLGAVLVAYRLRRLVERLLVGLDELDARRLQLAGGLGDVRIPQLALLELRLARELADQVLIGLGQLVPARLRIDEDLRDDQVAGEAVDLALGGLIVVLSEKRRLVVLRPVHHPGLQRLVQ